MADCVTSKMRITKMQFVFFIRIVSSLMIGDEQTLTKENE